jgi:GT2 family glycosyltransferase
MNLAIVVLNYRTPDYTEGCLRSLAAEVASLPGTRVLLLDNASGDDSVPRFQKLIEANGWTSWVELIVSERNTGFAGGNNVCLKRALAWSDPPEHLLLLNSDTVVWPGCLSHCAAFMSAHADVGALSCQLRNRDGSVQNVCRKFPRPDRETVRAWGLPYLAPRLFGWANLEDPDWDRETVSRSVEWVGGAFMWLRTAALRETGMLDETFFFYGEDTEFCYRMTRHGWKIWFDPGATITHFGGGSSDPTRMLDHRKDVLTWYARFHVQQRCYGTLAAAWMRGVYVAAFALRLGWLAIRGRRGSALYTSIASGLRTLTGPLDPLKT